jgi:hypothetical protein
MANAHYVVRILRQIASGCQVRAAYVCTMLKVCWQSNHTLIYVAQWKLKTTTTTTIKLINIQKKFLFKKKKYLKKCKYLCRRIVSRSTASIVIKTAQKVIAHFIY